MNDADRMWQIYLATRISEPAYGLWTLVIANAAVFVVFALSFGRPRTGLAWRSFGGFSAFIVALFVEMYGFPLTLYALSGWLQTAYPELDLLGHEAGHLWQTVFGVSGDAHASALHIASNVLVVAGLVLVVVGWRTLRRAQRAGGFATCGPYAYLRHPQYVGFILVLSGLLLQWPTVLTLVMFPVLLWMYGRLARREECELDLRFGEPYRHSVSGIPRFMPRFGWPGRRERRGAVEHAR